MIKPKTMQHNVPMEKKASKRALDRREAISGVAGLGALAAGTSIAFAPPALAASRPQQVINDRATLLPFIRKIKYATDDRLVTWWLRAIYYGYVSGRVTPLYNLEVASFHSAKSREDGGFDVTSLEIVFTTDVETGEYAKEIRNPYTDEMVIGSEGALGPTTISHAAEKTIYPGELPGARFDSEKQQGPLFVANGKFWLRDDSSTTVSFDEPGKADFFVSDLSFYQGLMSDIEDETVSFPPATVSFNAASSWPDRMKMGDKPGGMFARSYGEKVANIDDIPSQIRTLLDRFHPEIMADPLAALSMEPGEFSE